MTCYDLVYVVILEMLRLSKDIRDILGSIDLVTPNSEKPFTVLSFSGRERRYSRDELFIISEASAVKIMALAMEDKAKALAALASYEGLHPEDPTPEEDLPVWKYGFHGHIEILKPLGEPKILSNPPLGGVGGEAIVAEAIVEETAVGHTAVLSQVFNDWAGIEDLVPPKQGDMGVEGKSLPSGEGLKEEGFEVGDLNFLERVITEPKKKEVTPRKTRGKEVAFTPVFPGCEILLYSKFGKQESFTICNFVIRYRGKLYYNNHINESMREPGTTYVKLWPRLRTQEELRKLERAVERLISQGEVLSITSGEEVRNYVANW